MTEGLGFRSRFLLGKLGHDLRAVLLAEDVAVSDRLVAALNQIDPALERRNGVLTLDASEYRTVG